MLVELDDPLDLGAADLKRDPYPTYARLRAEAGMVRQPTGETVLLRHADCEQVLRDPRCSTNPVHRRLTPEEAANDVRVAVNGDDNHVLLFSDPPDHTRIRAVVSRWFTPRAVAGLRDHVQGLVDGMLDDAAERAEIDVLADLGFQLPATVICEIMGIPAEDRHLFAPWSSAATRLLDGLGIGPEEAEAAFGGAAQVIGYVDPLLEERRRRPGDDLLSVMASAAEAGELSEQELRALVILVFIAGHETTTNLIGNGVNALLDHPDQLERWRGDPSLSTSAVEELLRYDSPVHLTGRIPTEDMEVGGQRFAAGEQLMVLLAAANRDPAVFDRPESLDVGREDNRHLAFSMGIHHCLGASLARMEGQVVLGSLVQRFGRIERITDPVEHREHVVLRGLRELRISVA